MRQMEGTSRRGVAAKLPQFNYWNISKRISPGSAFINRKISLIIRILKYYS